MVVKREIGGKDTDMWLSGVPFGRDKISMQSLGNGRYVTY